MKFLIISQYFWPENFKINEIAKYLSKKDQVDILTSYPNFPNGKIYKKFINNKKKYNYYYGCSVFRVPQIARGSGSKLRIFINYLSFLLSTIFFSYKFFFKNYDRIFVFAPSPVFIGYIGLIISKFNKAKTSIWVLDFWPDILKELNLIKSKFFLKMLDLIIISMYRSFDNIFVQSKSFKKIIENKIKDSKKKILYIPSWTDDINLFAKKKNYKNKKLKILFTGSIGYAQNLDITINVTKKLIKSNMKKFEWIIVGDGRYKKRFIAKISQENLKKYFHFYNFQSHKNLKKFFHKASVCYLSLNKGKILNSTIPGKLQTYMSLGMPVLGSVSGEAYSIIKKSNCGLVSHASDEAQLFENILLFMDMNNTKFKRMSINGKKFVNSNFNKENILNTLYKYFVR